MDELEVVGCWEHGWPDKAAGPWVLRVVFALVGDRPAPVSVELYAVDPARIKKSVGGWPYAGNVVFPPVPQPITTTAVRVPLGEIWSDWLATERSRAEGLANLFPPVAFSEGKPYVEPVDHDKASARQLQAIDRLEGQHRKPPGRPAFYKPAHFEMVATVYAAALRAGLDPTLAVAEAMHVSKSAAGKWVAKCRSLGLLPPTTKGKAAAWPVPPRKRSKQP